MSDSTELTEQELEQLLSDIATRQRTTVELINTYGVSKEWLQEFVHLNRETLEELRATYAEEKTDEQLTPEQLSDLWITNKFERLLRLQAIAERLYFQAYKFPEAVNVREFRSYLQLAANELGQLLHRGAGEQAEETLNVEIQGIDMATLR